MARALPNTVSILPTIVGSGIRCITASKIAKATSIPEKEIILFIRYLHNVIKFCDKINKSMWFRQ